MAGEDADALRWRLYREGASAEDLERYRAAASAGSVAVEHEAAPEPEPRAPAPPARRRRRLLPPSAALVGVAAVVALAWAGSNLARPAPEAVAVAAPGAQLLAVTAQERDTLVSHLQRGRDAGLGAYFFAHVENRPPILQYPGRADTFEYHGAGSGSVALDPPAAALRGGRVTVVIVLAEDTRVRWRADRFADPAGRPAEWQPLATRSADLRAGGPAVATIAYAAPPPTRLAVRVPSGVHWGAAVVFTD